MSNQKKIVLPTQSVVDEINYHQARIDELRSQFPVNYAPLFGVAWLEIEGKRFGHEPFLRLYPGAQVRHQVATPGHTLGLKAQLEKSQYHAEISLVIDLQSVPESLS